MALWSIRQARYDFMPAKAFYLFFVYVLYEAVVICLVNVPVLPAIGGHSSAARGATRVVFIGLL